MVFMTNMIFDFDLFDLMRYVDGKQLSDEQMMQDGLAASHFQLLEAKLAHSFNKL